jgi:hypothetical protein
MSTELITRDLIANYIEVPGTPSAAYELMGAGFTSLEESPAAKTSSKRYVNDKSETKRISGYDWSTPFNTDMIKSEPPIDFIREIGEKQLTGADAETNYVIVSLDRPIAEESGTFYARRIKVAVEVASFENNDGEVAISGNLLGVGDMKPGKFDLSTKTFTEEV